MPKVDPEHPNPRAQFHAFMSSGRDQVKLAQMMVDLTTIATADESATFDEACALVGKIAAAVDPKGACTAARVEVEKKPAKDPEPVGAEPAAKLKN